MRWQRHCTPVSASRRLSPSKTQCHTLLDHALSLLMSACRGKPVPWVHVRGVVLEAQCRSAARPPALRHTSIICYTGAKPPAAAACKHPGKLNVANAGPTSKAPQQAVRPPRVTDALMPHTFCRARRRRRRSGKRARGTRQSWWQLARPLQARRCKGIRSASRMAARGGCQPTCNAPVQRPRT